MTTATLTASSAARRMSLGTFVELSEQEAAGDRKYVLTASHEGHGLTSRTTWLVDLHAAECRLRFWRDLRLMLDGKAGREQETAWAYVARLLNEPIIFPATIADITDYTDQEVIRRCVRELAAHLGGKDADDDAPF